MSIEPRDTDSQGLEAPEAEAVEETVLVTGDAKSAEATEETVEREHGAGDETSAAPEGVAETEPIAASEAPTAVVEVAAETEVLPAAETPVPAPTAVFGGPFAGPAESGLQAGFQPDALPVTPAPDPKRRAVFLATWLGSALAVGALAGGGILAATGSSTVKVALGAPAPSATPSSSAPPVPAGVRSDGTHYGPLTAFLLPMPDGYGPGPDEGLFGDDSAVTPDQLDAEVTELFGKLPTSDLTSAKGAMEAAHMTQGAVRTYLKTSSDVQFSILALQLDPSLAAKSTSDFLHIIKTSDEFRTGPAVPGHPEAQCVLPATAPGDKLDEMLCLDTVGDTFVIANAAGTVPMDQKSLTALFGNQVDLLKNGPAQ